MYKVLILPNAAALSDRQAQTIRDYVDGGGGAGRDVRDVALR